MKQTDMLAYEHTGRRHALIASLLAPLLVLAGMAGAQPSGEVLYRENCASCHGPAGRGGAPGAALFERRPPNLRHALAERTNDSLTAWILEGSSLQLPLDMPALRARAGDTQALVGYMRRLPRVDWTRADAGAVIYADRCETCHGAFGRPPAVLPQGVDQPPNIAEPAFQAHTDAELIEAVRHGRAGMPGLVPRLSGTEARDVAAYVRLLSPGFEIYAQYCAVCHGAHGRGVAGRAPEVVFDAAYFDKRDPEQLRRDVWHMVDQHRTRMPHFAARLSPAEATAIVEWLRTGGS